MLEAMSYFRRPALAAALLCAASACATSFHGAPTRAASDAPSAFSPEGGAPLPAGGACLSPLVDPRDETRITLARSVSSLGDYRVPEGRYGVGARELLRIDCATGRVVGIVRA